jgi:plasmid stabilization system protein ParE
MIRRRLAAVDGLIGQFEYVARRDPGAASRLVDAVERTLSMLERMPRLGRPFGESGSPLRRIRVRGVVGFDKHLLYYREIDGGIEWIGIRHASQDEPGPIDEA